MKNLLSRICSFFQRLRGRQDTTLVVPLDPAVIAEAFSQMGIPRASAEEAIRNLPALGEMGAQSRQSVIPMAWHDNESTQAMRSGIHFAQLHPSMDSAELLDEPQPDDRTRDFLGNVVPAPHSPLSTPPRVNTPPKVALVDIADNTRHEIPRVTDFTVRLEEGRCYIDIRLNVDRLQRHVGGNFEVLTAVLGPSARLACYHVMSPRVFLVDIADNTRHEIPSVTGFTVRRDDDRRLSLSIHIEVDSHTYTRGDPDTLAVALGPSARIVCYYPSAAIGWRKDCLYYSPAKELHCAVNPVGCQGCREFESKGRQEGSL